MVEAHGPASSEPTLSSTRAIACVVCTCTQAYKHTGHAHTQRKSSTAVLAFSPLLSSPTSTLLLLRLPYSLDG